MIFLDCRILGLVLPLVLVLLTGKTDCLDFITPFRRIFTRMPKLQLTMMTSRLITNFTSVENCAAECTKETTFDCRSFDVDNKRRMCKLYNISHEDGGAYLKEAQFTDHYKTAFSNLFNRLPNHVLTVKHKRSIADLSVEQCARRCIFEQAFRCSGFDYEPGYSMCYLTDLTIAESNGVKFQPEADFYERDLGGALSNFISYGSGSLPYIDERPIYSKTMYGLDLGACAQVCQSQTTFSCASFDYSFVDRSCQMSRYVAATVGGLDTNAMLTYRVMHFEKKGASLTKFYATPYRIVLGNNQKKVERVTPEKCAKACLDEASFVCRSFDYEINDASCSLSPKTGSDVGGLYDQGHTQIHHFEMKPSLDCGGIINAIDGDISSPGWPRNYSHHLNCTWDITVPAHKIIKFTFIHFDLGPTGETNKCSTDLDRDLLRITEMTPHGHVNFCAHPPMSTYISYSNSVQIAFTSNGRHDAQGFRIAFKGDWPCHATLMTDRGEIASPHWPEQYSPGLHCVWTIQAPPKATISLKFTTIDLDGQGFGPCTSQTDMIEVYDGATTSSVRLARFCHHEAATPIISTRNVLLVSFQSNGFIQRTGFHASYDFNLPPTTTQRTTTSTTTTTTTTTVAPPYYYDQAGGGGGGGGGGGDPMAVDENEEPLTAEFAEPKNNWRHYEDNSGHQDNIDGVYEGGYYHRGDTDQTYYNNYNNYESDNDSSSSSADPKDNTYVTVLWTVLASFFFLTIVLAITLLSVCRYNTRRRERRKKAEEKYKISQEESLSLYEREQKPPKVFEEDAISFREFTLGADVAFANPLYESRRVMSSPPCRSPMTLLSDSVSDSGCSSSNNSSNSNNGCGSSSGGGGGGGCGNAGGSGIGGGGGGSSLIGGSTIVINEINEDNIDNNNRRGSIIACQGSTFLLTSPC